MIIIQYLLALASAIGAVIIIGLLVVIRYIWPILACIAMAIVWTRGPEIAHSLGDGLAPRFVTVYDSSQFDHTTGRWNLETGKKIK